MLQSAHASWGERLVHKVEAYLRDTFGMPTDIVSDPPAGLPYFMADRYAFWRGTFFDRPFVLMAPRAGSEATVDEMARHAQLVRDRSGAPLVILLFETLSPNRRQALVKRRMAFMVPAAQLFVPEVLMELRERTPRAPIHDVEQFSPTAQLVILGALLRRETEGTSATALAQRYGVANMSMTRAFDELQAAGLADAERIGKPRALRFRISGRKLWDAAAPRLQSPVRKIRIVGIPFPEQFPGRLAGESALSWYTSLARPRAQRLAVASANWNQLVRDHGLVAREAGDPAGDEIETWSYDPAALTTEKVVDRLSLYLSTRDHPDERVAQAADQLLEDMAWS